MILRQSRYVTGMWEVGSYDLNGNFYCVFSSYNYEEATYRCHYLNGGR